MRKNRSSMVVVGWPKLSKLPPWRRSTSSKSRRSSSLTGKPDAVKLLIETGAEVNAVEPYKGQTALMWAASEGNAAAAEILLARGNRHLPGHLADPDDYRTG